MAFRYTRGKVVVTSPTDLSDDQLEEAFAPAPTGQPVVPRYKPGGGPPSFPAGQYPGKRAKNDTTGEMFQSDGSSWQPIPPAADVTQLPVKNPPVDTGNFWGAVGRAFNQQLDPIRRGSEALWRGAEHGGIMTEAETLAALPVTAAGVKFHGLGRTGLAKSPVQGPPEFIGPPEPPPPPLPPGPSSPFPQRALPPGAPPPAMKALPPAGGTSPSAPGRPRTFAAGPGGVERVTETPSRGVQPNVRLPLPAPGPGGGAIGLPETLGRDPGAYPMGVLSGKPTGPYRPPETYPTTTKSVGPEIPARYIGTQEIPGRPGLRLYNLTEDVPGLGPKDTTLSEPTLQKFFGRLPEASTTRELTPPADTRNVPVRRFRPPNAPQTEDLGQAIPPGRTPAGAVEPSAPLSAAPTTEPLAPTAPTPRGQATAGMSADELREMARNRAGLATPPGQVRTPFRSIAPDQTAMFERAGDPAAAQIGTAARDWTLARRGFINEELKTGSPALRDIRTPEDKALTSILLDQPVTPAALKSLQVDRPNVVRAYQVLGERYDALANARGIPWSARKSDYFPRLFENVEIKAGSVDYNITKFLQASRGRLPDTVRPFFEYARSGAPGYRLDPHWAYEQYVRRMADKLYHEPFLQKANDLVPQIADQGLQRQANEYAGRYGRIEPKDWLERRGEDIRQAEFMAKLGGNPRWSLLNWFSGRLASFSHFLVEEGYNPATALRDMRMGRAITKTPEGQAWLERSGHTGSSFLEEHVNEGSLRSRAMDLLTLKVSAIEKSNRGQVYFGELWRQQGKPSMEKMQQILREGRVPIGAQGPELPVSVPNRIVGETQGLYGEEFDPKWLRQSYIRPLSQFSGTPAKILYGLGAKPQKLLMYAVLSEGVEELSRLVGGPDMRSTLGFGVNIQGLIRDLAEGQPALDAVKKNTWDEIVEGRGGIVSFAVAPVVSAGRTISRVAREDRTLPGAERRVGETVLREFVAPDRAYKAGRDLQQGGTAWEAGRQAVGWPADATKTRQVIMQHLYAGDKKRAEEALDLYNAAHPGVGLSINEEQWQAALQEAADRRDARAAQQEAISPDVRQRERQPRRIQDILR